jgi:hypothetical protein
VLYVYVGWKGYGGYARHLSSCSVEPVKVHRGHARQGVEWEASPPPLQYYNALHSIEIALVK